MAHAQFIMLRSGRLVAIFSGFVASHRLKHIANRLSAMRGVKAQVDQETLTVGGAPMRSIWLTARESIRPEAATAMRELTHPLLPYTLELLRVQLLKCRACGRLSLAATGKFVDGLGPSDKQQLEAFWAQLGKNLTSLRLDELLPQGLKSWREVLADSVDQAVRLAGAYPSKMTLTRIADGRPCRHQR